MGHRTYAAVVSVAVLVAVLWPLQQKKLVDDFPLSTYPMFSVARPPELHIDPVVALAGERRQAVAPAYLGSREVLQAKVIVERIVDRGRSACAELCTKVAARIAEDGDLPWATEVEVRSDRYQVLGYFTSARKSLWGRSYARCPIPGRGAP